MSGQCRLDRFQSLSAGVRTSNSAHWCYWKWLMFFGGWWVCDGCLMVAVWWVMAGGGWWFGDSGSLLVLGSGSGECCWLEGVGGWWSLVVVCCCDTVGCRLWRLDVGAESDYTLLSWPIVVDDFACCYWCGPYCCPVMFGVCKLLGCDGSVCFWLLWSLVMPGCY